MGLGSAFESAAGRGGRPYKGNMLVFGTRSNNPNIYRISCNGKIKVKSVLNGNVVVRNYENLNNSSLSIQADANSEIKIYGDVTKLHLFNHDMGSGFSGATYIDLSNITSIIELDCNENPHLQYINFCPNTTLTTLNCLNCTGIQSLDVSANTALTSLNCNNTGITSLDVSANTALTSLICNRTSITSLDVSANTALTSLNCDNTSITSLDVSANTALTTLNCQNCTSLQILNMSTNTLLDSNSRISSLYQIKAIYYPATNDYISNRISTVISQAQAADGTVYTDSAADYYQTIADAATAKGWTIEQL